MVVVIEVCDRVFTPFEVKLVRTRLGDIGQSQRLTTLPPASGFTHTKARSHLKSTRRRMYSAVVCRFEWLKRALCVHGLRSARWTLAATELLKTRAFEACGGRILARRGWLRACVAAA